jgi:iron complex transport system substrate-binding protein
MKKLTLLILVLSFFSCAPPLKENIIRTGNKYATGFDILSNGNFTEIKIYNPWQKAENTEYNYVLCEDRETLPDSFKSFTIINLPVEKVVVLSTTHVGFISALGEENKIRGVSGTRYVVNEKIREAADSGMIVDVGYAPDIDFEQIIELEPDVVFIYGLKSSVSGIIARLHEVGIPAVIIGEYLEKHPLGKLEWLKVFAAILQKSDTADKIIQGVEVNYLSNKRKLNDISIKPSVLTGLPWKDTWFMTGGNTFQSQLIADAGGDFLWKENNSEDYIPLDLESVFIKALEADVWINTGSASSMKAVSSRDSRFEKIKAFDEKEVYNNDRKLNQFGGNDYWESGVVHPDLILQDLIKIFHPDIMKDYQFEYYRKLPED